MAASPERPSFAFDGDEEPLFADDLDEFGDDDIGLPPAMPSLAELSARQDRVSENRAAGTRDMGQTSVPGFDLGVGTTANQTGTNDDGPPLKKRKPILTLKIDRIFSDKGLKYIQTEFPKLKFKGKGHELSDLKHLMKGYEHWANMLYPKMTFSDVTDRIEALAKKREFKTNLIRMRRRQVRGGAETPPLSDNEDLDDHPTVPPNGPQDDPPPDNQSATVTLSPTQDNIPTSPHSVPNENAPATSDNAAFEFDF